jgi:hypothetical protein
MRQQPYRTGSRSSVTLGPRCHDRLLSSRCKEHNTHVQTRGLEQTKLLGGELVDNVTGEHERPLMRKAGRFEARA